MGSLRRAIDRVEEAADIVEVVSPYTDLRRAGQRFSGLCPFHDERTPSFSVDPVGKLYYCFGCEVGGDVFRFVQEKEGLDFPEAVETLAERYGVELERESEDPQGRGGAAPPGAALRAAGADRGVLRAVPVGVAEGREGARVPGGPRAVRGGAARVRGRDGAAGVGPGAGGEPAGEFTIEELGAAGLIQKGRQGGHYDRFRTRITFPDPRPAREGAGVRGAGAERRTRSRST